MKMLISKFQKTAAIVGTARVECLSRAKAL